VKPIASLPQSATERLSTSHSIAGDGREFEAWDEITRHAEDLPEDEVRALIEDLAGWPGRRPACPRRPGR
jgi:hypothetical protein